MTDREAVRHAYEATKNRAIQGLPASYIPELAKVDPKKFGLYFLGMGGEGFGLGDWEEPFSIQSISKVFSLAMAYRLLGDKIWERVGVEPSGTPFNSLTQLESDRGIPRNPFINAGAMVICDMLLESYGKARETMLAFMRDLSGQPDIGYNERVFSSEKATGYRNVALCNFIKSYGNIAHEPKNVLDLYFHSCSLEMNCRDLAQAAFFLANEGLDRTGKRVLNVSRTKRINALMQTCGFYDESGEFSFLVGLPGKSGVGGGIIAVRPGQYALAVWSPPLNAKGNSSRGMKFLEEFTTEAKSSIF